MTDDATLGRSTGTARAGPFRWPPLAVRDGGPGGPSRAALALVAVAAFAWITGLVAVLRWDRARAPAPRLVRFERVGGGEVRVELQGRPVAVHGGAWLSTRGMRWPGDYDGPVRVDLATARGLLGWPGWRRSLVSVQPGPGGVVAEGDGFEGPTDAHEVRVFEPGGGGGVVARFARLFAFAWVDGALEIVCVAPRSGWPEGGPEAFVFRAGSSSVRPLPCDRDVATGGCRALGAAWREGGRWRFARATELVGEGGRAYRVDEWSEGAAPSSRAELRVARFERVVSSAGLGESVAFYPRVDESAAREAGRPMLSRSAAGEWSGRLLVGVTSRDAPRVRALVVDARGAPTLVWGRERRWQDPRSGAIELVDGPRGAVLRREGRPTGETVAPRSFVHDETEWLPDERGGGWLLSHGLRGVWLAHVDAGLRRDDVPGLAARLRDAPDAVFAGATEAAVPTWQLASRRLVLPWLLLGWPLAFVVGSIAALRRGVRAWSINVARGAAVWGAGAAPLVPMLRRILELS